MPKGYKTNLSEEDKENIKKLYLNENKSIHELRKIYKICENKIKQIVINVRSIQESIKIGCGKRPKTLTEETKKEISIRMKQVHKEGNHPGWLHINSDKNRRSFPEKVFLNQLKIFNLLNKYTFMEKMPFGKYALDFALIDMKIDIEIDGQQHFRSESAINHDKERDGFVKSKGWKIYRIAYKEMQNNLNKVMIDLVEWINNIEINSDRFYNIKEIKLEYAKNKYIKKSKEELEKTYKKRRKFEISKEELEK